MTRVIEKKVELAELFYDLVFVYAISQATGLIHHFHQGAQFGLQFLTFAIVLVVFINTWMIETVYTNRYGKNSLANIIFFMVNMGMLLFLSNAFYGEINEWFKVFSLTTGMMTLTLFLQYVLTYFKALEKFDQRIAKSFILILGLRASFTIIAAFIPLPIGIPLAIMGVLISWLLPGFFTSVMRPHPINFPHLLERLRLLVIITFGETIMGISGYFTQDELSVESILIFIIVCALFLTYIIQFDHSIEANHENETGVRLIYLHYPIIFGISLVTVALEFIGDESVSKLFAVVCLYLGIALLYIGIYFAKYYNKDQVNLTRFYVYTSVIILAGCLMSLLIPSFISITSITAMVTVVNAALFHFLLKRRI